RDRDGARPRDGLPGQWRGVGESSVLRGALALERHDRPRLGRRGHLAGRRLRVGHARGLLRDRPWPAALSGRRRRTRDRAHRRAAEPDRGPVRKPCQPRISFLTSSWPRCPALAASPPWIWVIGWVLQRV